MVKFYIQKLFKGFFKNPVGFVKRAIFKTITGPIKYGKGDDYSASQYWHDRFSKYGCALQGAGDESISNEENVKRYQAAAVEFKRILEHEDIDFNAVNVLEIGVGSAFFTQVLCDLGVNNLTGVDITDFLFEQHNEKFPGYNFIKRDITTDAVEGKYDLITMIDVVQHIVNEKKLTGAMENIKICMNSRSAFLIAPLMEKDQKHHFYVHQWSSNMIKKHFSGYVFSDLISFKSCHALIIKNTID